MSITAFPIHRFDISVIIPVEFHRGQSIDCVRGWAMEQCYPSEQYQIILCAPNTLKPETEAEIRSLLRPWDHLEKRPLSHDMPLIAEAAYLAESELLLFTESHCLPDKNALNSLLGIAEDHPEWSGFSCPTTPITHNLLSEIEADIYVSHIQRELESNGWLKVMDQCFLVRRSAYFDAGGFRPSFGHFAEWLLAADMHRLGKVVGFNRHSVIKHYYSGNVNDLEAFTLDFAKGQIKYLAECNNMSTYFPEIPELLEYRQRSQVNFRRIVCRKTATLLAIIINIRQTQEQRILIVTLLIDLLTSLLKLFGIRPTMYAAFWSAHCAKRRLQHALRRQNYDQAKEAFIDWFAKLVHLGRVQYLASHPFLHKHFIRNPHYTLYGKWHAGVTLQENSTIECQEFFDNETTVAGHSFRWSNACASVWLPLCESSYQITIEWLSVRQVSLHDILDIQFDGRTIAPTLIKVANNTLTLVVVTKNSDWYRLDWSVIPFPANGDRRILGLPITTIHWFSINQA